MARSRSAFLLALRLAGSAGLQCTPRYTVPFDPEQEEYAVYSAVITQKYVTAHGVSANYLHGFGRFNLQNPWTASMNFFIVGRIRHDALPSGAVRA
jgi:hypothetical protein